jgi:hypothetical protein
VGGDRGEIVACPHRLAQLLYLPAQFRQLAEIVSRPTLTACARSFRVVGTVNGLRASGS